MQKTSIDRIKALRAKTGAPVSLCKEALERSNNNFDKALVYLRHKGAEILEKRQAKKVGEGVIAAYIHSNKKIGSLVELTCETDFVSRNQKFIDLAHDLAMQIAATDPADVSELMAQPFIKDESIKVSDLINEKVTEFGEPIRIKRFVRYAIG